MKFNAKCHDCGKSLFMKNKWYHPTIENAYLCDDCTHKYDEERNKEYLKTLEKSFNNIVKEFTKLMKF